MWPHKHMKKKLLIDKDWNAQKAFRNFTQLWHSVLSATRFGTFCDAIRYFPPHFGWEFRGGIWWVIIQSTAQHLWICVMKVSNVSNNSMYHNYFVLVIDFSYSLNLPPKMAEVKIRFVASLVRPGLVYFLRESISSRVFFCYHLKWRHVRQCKLYFLGNFCHINALLTIFSVYSDIVQAQSIFKYIAW